ncbi:MAG: HDOD domain-containing protein [Gammaproteobacteria bacterium]
MIIFKVIFFHKPEINVGHFIKPIKLNLLLLFAEACQQDIDFYTLAEIISQDVSLVNGVLKLVNFETERNRIEIRSIKQAVTYLGSKKIKQFIAIIAMSKLSSDCNSELLMESLLRGKMMEYISFSPDFIKIRGVAFITGVMSHIGAILNCPIEKIIMDLPLAEEIKTALVSKRGLLHDALEIVKHYEFSETHEETCPIMAKHNISEEALLMHYHDALKWCCATCR